MSRAWTPGPWATDGTMVVAEGTVVKIVARAEKNTMLTKQSEAAANARMLAAAPDLYASLVEMVQTYWEEAKDYEPPPELIQRAKRALSKARGGQ